jgi:ATP-dependent Lon protease
VVVDYEADVQAHMPTVPDSDRLEHRFDQQLGLAWTPVGGVLLPVEARWKPSNGRVTATGRLGSVLNESAQVAGAYVQGNAVRLVPGMAGEWFASHDIQIDVAGGDVPRSATLRTGRALVSR